MFSSRNTEQLPAWINPNPEQGLIFRSVGKSLFGDVYTKLQQQKTCKYWSNGREILEINRNHTDIEMSILFI